MNTSRNFKLIHSTILFYNELHDDLQHSRRRLAPPAIAPVLRGRTDDRSNQHQPRTVAVRAERYSARLANAGVVSSAGGAKRHSVGTSSVASCLHERSRGVAGESDLTCDRSRVRAAMRIAPALGAERRPRSRTAARFARASVRTTRSACSPWCCRPTSRPSPSRSSERPRPHAG